MMEKPEFNDWKKQNPGKSINDYYRMYPPVPTGSFRVPTERYSHSYLDESEEHHQPYSTKVSSGKIWIYISVILVVIITFLSNPDRDEHTFAVKVELKGVVEKWILEKTNNLLLSALGTMAANVFIDEIVGHVSVDNYLFFSLTKLNYQTHSRIIGIGILGRVYIFDDLNERVKEIINEMYK